MLLLLVSTTWICLVAGVQFRLEETFQPAEGPERDDLGAVASVRDLYMDEKLSIDRSVITSLPELDRSRSLAPTGGKVAFLFLLMDALNWESLWSSFFEPAHRYRYSIYVHRAERPRSASLPLRNSGAIEVNWVNSSWCALVGVEVAMLHTALGDPNNMQFVFLAHDTIPLQTFAYVFKELVETSPQTSKFCFADEARHVDAFVEYAANGLNSRCVFRDFYRPIDPRTLKHHQWIVLSRQHAEVFVQRALLGQDRWAKVWRAAAPDLSSVGEGCSDESVPVTTLLLDAELKGISSGDTWQDLAAMGVEQKCLTFVHWYNCFQGTNFSLTGSGLFQQLTQHIPSRIYDLIQYMFDSSFDLKKEEKLNGFPTEYIEVQVQYLTLAAQSGFMFARKFPVSAQLFLNTTSLNMAAVLPDLWHLVNHTEASQSVWTRLSSVESA